MARSQYKSTIQDTLGDVQNQRVQYGDTGGGQRMSVEEGQLSSDMQAAKKQKEKLEQIALTGDKQIAAEKIKGIDSEVARAASNEKINVNNLAANKDLRKAQARNLNSTSDFQDVNTGINKDLGRQRVQAEIDSSKMINDSARLRFQDDTDQRTTDLNNENIRTTAAMNASVSLANAQKAAPLQQQLNDASRAADTSFAGTGSGRQSEVVNQYNPPGALESLARTIIPGANFVSNSIRLPGAKAAAAKKAQSLKDTLSQYK